MRVYRDNQDPETALLFECVRTNQLSFLAKRAIRT